MNRIVKTVVIEMTSEFDMFPAKVAEIVDFELISDNTINPPQHLPKCWYD